MRQDNYPGKEAGKKEWLFWKIKVKPPKLVSFTKIRISVPRKFLLQCYYSGKFLTRTQHHRISAEKRKYEQTKNKVEHLLSIVNEILLKSVDLHHDT